VSVSNQDIVAQGRKVASVADVLASDDEIVPSLLEELQYQARNSAKTTGGEGSPGEVTIMGDKQIPYALLKKIMKTCAMANYTDISLAVMHKAARG